MNLKPFQQAERDFLLLKGQLATKRITQAQFDTALEKLTVRDENGRAWKMDAESGAWSIQQDESWVPADPASPPPAPEGEAGTPVAKVPRITNWVPILALGAVLVVCVCGIGAFLGLNALGVVTTQLNLFRGSTPTLVASLGTTTPFSTFEPVGTTAAPGDTPIAIETAVPFATITLDPFATDSANPFATDSANPFATAANTTPGPTSDLPTSFVAFDANFFGDPCPLFEGDSDVRTYSCDFGEYNMLHKQATTRYSYYDVVYNDAVVEGTGYFIEGKGKYEYGLVFRGNTDGTEYYVFTVTNDGKYNVALYQNEKYTDLIPYTASPIVQTGTEANVFKVVLRGSRFDFYLNDEFLNSVTNAAIPSGVTGFFFYNDEPNVKVGFDELTVSTFTPLTPTPESETVVPTATRRVVVRPTVTATPVVIPTEQTEPGVYVNTIRFEPRAPKRGDPITFYATFVNSTGKPVNYTWLVEIWEQDPSKRNPYGQADALSREVPVGSSELATGDSWKVAGGGPCLPFRARVVRVDEQTGRVPFKQTNGADLWVSFQVCP